MAPKPKSAGAQTDVDVQQAKDTCALVQRFPDTGGGAPAVFREPIRP